MKLTLASPSDAPALLEVYGQYIQTPITFEYVLPTAEEFACRVASILEAGYPYLVCREGDRILGYAYAHRHMERAAYQWDAELSIYLSSSAAGRGLGRTLYRALMELLTLQGIKTVYGLVTLGNPASQGLHRSLGFRLIEVHRSTGYKNGVWHDVQWFEKSLAPYDPDPQPVIPLPQLPEKTVQDVLARNSG